MNEQQLFTALTRSSRKALRLYYNATGDNRAIGGQVETGDIVSSAYESYLSITAKLGAPIGYALIGNPMERIKEELPAQCWAYYAGMLVEPCDCHVPFYWYGDDETGHPVTAYAVIKWAVSDALRANGLRRDQTNPTDESLDLDRHAKALVPSVTPVRGALKSDDVETVTAGLRIAMGELPRAQAVALANAFRVFRESDAVREYDAVSLAKVELMAGLRGAGLSRDKARDTMQALAGDVLGTINATRGMFNA